MSTNKYSEGFAERLKPQKDPITGETIPSPFYTAQKALLTAQFVSRERANFFDAAFVEIMARTFERWLKSEPHAWKEREFLYQSILALGEVKAQLIAFEMLLSNAAAVRGVQKEPPAENEGGM